MQEQIIKANWFSNLNFLIRFNHVKVKEEDKYEMAF